ncbi:MAG: hypothetical protein F9B45_32540 [Phycisphaera sp. RhM]|nr:hypothetical protein [Phycisphaera sp. RhM]
MKKYSNSDFSFVLPDEWACRDESDASMQLSVFECPDAASRVTVSLRRYAPETPHSDVAESFSEFVRIRRSAEVDVCDSPDDLVLTPEEIVNGGDYLYCKYAGIHGPQDRRLAALLTAENGKMLCFYVESSGTSDDYFNSLANSIFDSIEVF